MTVVPRARWLFLRVVWPICILGIGVGVLMFSRGGPEKFIVLVPLALYVPLAMNLMPRWCELRGDLTVVARMWTGREVTISLADNAMAYAPLGGFRLYFASWIIKDDSGARVYLPPLPLNWRDFLTQLEAHGVTVTATWDRAEWASGSGLRLRKRAG